MTYLCYNLSELPADDSAVSTLNDEERAIYARRGESFLKTRSTLKRALAMKLGCDAQMLCLATGEHGKPYLPGCELHFNISHSGDLLCIAFHHTPIGIDVQQIRPAQATPRLARRIMCPQQLAAWQQRGAGTQEFFDCWCTTEALVKQAGATIWQAKRFPYIWHTGHIRLLADTPILVNLFAPAQGYRAAVAFSTSSLQAPAEHANMIHQMQS